MTAWNQANSNRLACLLLAALAMLGCFQSSFAEDLPLSLTIRAMATEVVVGEPIVLEVTLRNEGEKTVQVEHYLRQHGNLTAFYYIKGEGDTEPRRLVSGVSRDWHPPAEPLEPKQEIRHVEWLHFDLRAPTTDQGRHQLVAAKPGVYTLHVEFNSLNNYLNRHLVFRSNPVSVAVKDSKPEWNRVVDLMSDLETGYIFEDGLESITQVNTSKLTPQQRERFENRDSALNTILETDSPYAPYVGLVFGAREINSTNTFAASRVLAADDHALRALDYLEPADKQSFPLQSEVVWYLREAAVILGDDTAVERLTKRLETEFADTHAAKRPIRASIVVQQPQPAVESTDGLVFELSIIGARDIGTTDERSAAPGQDSIRLPQGRPLALRVELRNESPDRSVVVPTINPSFGYILFETRFAEAEWVRLSVREWEIAGDSIPGQQTLAPGESVVWELALEDRLASNRESGFTKLVDQYLFDKLGEYELRASLNFLWPVELQVVSNIVSVEVVERRDLGWWVIGLAVGVPLAFAAWLVTRWKRPNRRELQAA